MPKGHHHNHARGIAHGRFKGYPSGPLYRAWRNMRNRCNNAGGERYKDYGGRGISICSRWQDFKVFAADMGPHPGKGWTLDRYPNNNGNYEPSNCRWATKAMQNKNQRPRSVYPPRDPTTGQWT